MSAKNMVIVPLAAIALLAGGAFAGYASIAGAQSASTTGNTTVNANRALRPAKGPHVEGTITAISGTDITITSNTNGGGTYTINASNATVVKNGATTTLSSFAVGDKIVAAGTITGTNVVATFVADHPAKKMGGQGMHGPGSFGRGPGVMGTVSAVNGSTITVTGKNGKTFTVNASGASVQRMVAGSLSDVAVGDTIGVQGTVSGTTVTANTIMDDIKLPAQK